MANGQISRTPRRSVTPSASTAGLIGPKATARTARNIATAESTTPQAATPTSTG